MALDLNEYIKMSYERPNRKVLEGLGASEDLIEYLMETPGNTNWNVVGSIASDSGDKAEVWYTGTFEEHREGNYILNVTATDKANPSDMVANYLTYEVFLNGEQLPFIDYFEDEGDKGVTWGIDNAEKETGVTIGIVNGQPFFDGFYNCDIDNPPSGAVEISVKTK